MTQAVEQVFVIILFLSLSSSNRLSGARTAVTTNQPDGKKISVSPHFVLFSSSVDQARFQCYFNGLPAREGQIVWTRNDEIVPCDMSKRVFACTNIIIIRHVTADDAGQYKCVCVLSNYTRKSVTASILVPASISNRGKETVVVSRGEDRRLECLISNDSYPQSVHVLWRHDGAYMSIGSVLYLRDIGENETGVYECIASNGYGTPDAKVFQLFLVGQQATTRTTTTTKTKSNGSSSSRRVAQPVFVLCVLCFVIARSLGNFS